MQMTISSRHAPLDPDLRERAGQVLARLGRHGHRAVTGAAVFDAVAGQSHAELRLQIAGGSLLVATAEAGDYRSALDRAETRLRHQLSRIAGRPRSRRLATG